MSALVRERSFVELDCDDISERIVKLQQRTLTWEDYARRLEADRQAAERARQEAERAEAERQRLKAIEAARTPKTPSEIIAAVAAEFGLTAQDIIGKGRTCDLTRPRQVVAYVLRERGNSYPMTAKHMRRKDHTTPRSHALNFEKSASSRMRKLAAQLIGTKDGVAVQLGEAAGIGPSLGVTDGPAVAGTGCAASPTGEAA